jgi:hypothetical protein
LQVAQVDLFGKDGRRQSDKPAIDGVKKVSNGTKEPKC